MEKPKKILVAIIWLIAFVSTISNMALRLEIDKLEIENKDLKSRVIEEYEK